MFFIVEVRVTVAKIRKINGEMDESAPAPVFLNAGRDIKDAMSYSQILAHTRTHTHTHAHTRTHITECGASVSFD